MTGFLILAGLVVVGILFAVISMMKDKGNEIPIAPISPDQVSFEGNLLAREKSAPPKPEKTLKVPPVKPIKQKSEKSGGLLGSLFRKKPPQKDFNLPTAPPLAPKKAKKPLFKLPNLLPFGKKVKIEKLESIEPLISLKETVSPDKFFQKPNEPKELRLKPILETPQTGTAAMKAALSSVTPSPQPPPSIVSVSKEMEEKIEKEIHLTTQLDELKEKFERTEKLFTEKSKELEKSQVLLDSELKNKREFNKVKDLLEKELADTRDRIRKVQVEFTSTKTESESYKKRINQLEEKVTKLEKELLKKDDEVDDLTKRLQTAASIPAKSAQQQPPVEPRQKTAPTPEPTLSPPQVVAMPEPPPPQSLAAEVTVAPQPPEPESLPKEKTPVLPQPQDEAPLPEAQLTPKEEPQTSPQVPQQPKEPSTDTPENNQTNTTKG